MLYDVANGQTSNVFRVKLRSSSVTTGAGLTGLTSASSGLIISTIADNEASPTVYTVAGSTVESIATLGTFAAPTATKCRFKEVSSANHPGLYEVQIADARFAVSSAKALTVSFSGATNLAECDVVIPLRAVNPYLASFGLVLAKTTNLTGLNDIAATAVVSAGAINTSSGAVSLVTAVTSCGTLTTYTGNTPQTGDAYALANGASGFVAIKANTAAVAAKLPANNIADETLVIAAVGSPMQAGSTVTLAASQPNYAPATAAALASLVTTVGAAGAGLTALAPASTALSTGVWTGTKAGFLDAAISSVAGGSAPTALDNAAAVRTNLAVELARVDAAVSTRSTYAGGAVASVTGTVNATLVATGLDAITATDPGGVSNHTTIPRMLVALYRRFYRKTTLTSSELKTLADDGTTVNTTQAVSYNGTTQTQGPAA